MQGQVSCGAECDETVHVFFQLQVRSRAERDCGTCACQEWGRGGAVPRRSASEREIWV